MKDINYFSKIYVAVNPVDFRKQARGLAILVKEVLAGNPLEGKSLFVFTNRSKDSVRILYWDHTGFALWSKVLEKDRFKWPKSKEEAKLIFSSRELKWILQGVDLTKIKMHDTLNFKEIF